MVHYLCVNCITSAVTLTKDILCRLRSSIFALSYFVRSLILPHISGLFSSPSLLIRYSEFSPTKVAPEKDDHLKSLKQLDEQIVSILSSTILEQYDLSVLSSQLVDSLKLSSLPLIAMHKSNVLFQSPTSAIFLFVNLFRTLLKYKDSQRRNRMFWVSLKSFSDFLSSMQPLQFCAIFEPTFLNHLHFLLDCLAVTIQGLGRMKVCRIREFDSSESKFLFSQIRSVNFSSPIVIPNASTSTGDYSIGIWLKIPQTYYQQICKFEVTIDGSSSNPSCTHNFPPNSIKTHILSRVPEAGDIDMTSLFQVYLFTIYI